MEGRSRSRTHLKVLLRTMSKPPVYSAELAALRPDKDDHLLEGSACVVRVSLERNEPSVEGGALYESTPPHDEPEMVTIGGKFLSLLMKQAIDQEAVCRVDFTTSSQGWLWPRLVREPPHVDEVLKLIAREVEGSREPGTHLVEIWVVPGREERAATLLIEGFREDPGSRVLWRQILKSGTVHASIGGSVCSIATHCDEIEALIGTIEACLRAADLRPAWR